MQPRDFLAEDMQAPESENIAPRDFLAEDQTPQESLPQSLLYAVPRISGDLLQGAKNVYDQIPSYINSARTEIPGAINQYANHPLNALMQELAGSQEGINQIAQAPLNLAKYGNQRLNLVPESAVNFLQKITPEDTTQAINQLFPQASQPGESLLRGLGRNAANIIGGSEIGAAINPLRLTESGIAKNVLKEERRQVLAHNRMYNNLWRDAERAGINNVPINENLVNTNLDFIRQYKSPKSYRTLEYFNEHPTLENAQPALSDLKAMRRALDEKSRTDSLTGEERNLYDAIHNTERHIENNMFLNPDGTRNEILANRYRGISNSYRENVVPYRYNNAIQAYKAKEITKHQLVNALKTGEFAAKKGAKHPAITIRNNLLPAIGLGGGLGGLGYYAYKLGQEANQ